MANHDDDHLSETPELANDLAGERDGPAGGASFPIVGVGASAGGLEAFTQLLKHLPADTGMSFVLVQHLDPEHESALTQILSRVTSLPVREITNHQPVQANHVHVIPPDTNLSIVQGVLKLQPRQQTRVPHRPIDAFFESLAQDQRERAVGVVLSGTASDGTQGLEAIKAEGGITFAQDDSAKHDSMPRSAVAAGCVDLVLSPAEIAKELARIAKHPYVVGQPLLIPAEDDRASATTPEDDRTPLPARGRKAPRAGAKQMRAEGETGRGEGTGAKSPEHAYKKILLLLRNHSGVDFSLYKSTTIQRRVSRRLMLSKQRTLEDYAGFLRGNATELDTLYSDVLISVTSFFRNAETFDALQREVLPKLLEQRGNEPLRCWVLGCSTGQEAYSIAIAFVETAEKAPRMRKLQIFATDLNDALLEKARHGLYAKSLAEDVAPERLRRFFVEEEGGYRVSKTLREMVVFARQNIIADPPFSRMDLISCRNLLIYLEPSLHRKALPTFHYALKPEGFLLLGASESIGGFTDLFEPVDKKHRIYSKKAAPTPTFQLQVRSERDAPSSPGQRPPAPTRQPAGPESLSGARGELTAQREADRVTVTQFAPPGVLVNAELQVLQFRGATGAYLQPPAGKASFDVLKMAREGLMLPLRAAINQAKEENKPARKENVRVRQNGKTRTISVEVIPLKNLRERCFLILFEPTEAGRNAGHAPSAEDAEPAVETALPSAEQESIRVAELETDLLEAREYLQSLQEQHEAATEELQASNEEVQSANEELQSLNEELETSKEELESANEELTTVNEEMSNRNVELNRLNSDLVNLQTSARLAVVLLGLDLTIRRFSSLAEKQFDLLATDVGRPISHLRHHLVFADAAESPADLEGLSAEVIANLREQEREVRDQAGRWYSLRVRPYLTLDNKVDGAVLVLVDIDIVKRSQEALLQSDARYRAIFDATSVGVSESDPATGRLLRVNEQFARIIGYTAREVVGKTFLELTHPDDRSGDREGSRLVRSEIVSHEIEKRVVRKDGTFVWVHDTVNVVRDASGRPLFTVTITLDITERKRAEQALGESYSRFEALFDASPVGMYLVDAELRIRLVSGKARPVFGDIGELNGRDFVEVIHILWPPESADEIVVRFRHTLETGEPYSAPEFSEERYDRKVREYYDWQIHRISLPDGQYGVVCYFFDISERMRLSNELRRYAADLSEADRRKNEFLAMLAHELRNPLAPICNALEIIRTRGDGETVQSASAMMERQVGQMVRLVDDLLDVSRISRGTIELRKGRIELASVVHHAVEAVRPLTESMDHELTVTLPPEPIYLNADPTRLAQVVGNLLNNACKFTSQGGRIRLTVEREGDQAVIQVRDTGIGIAPDQLRLIFDMFTQIDTSLERSQGGLGIGLTLVKSLVEMHDGTVEARSAGLGHGSEFEVRLPIQAEPAEAPQPEPTAGAPGTTTARRILVVDDNRDSATSLAMLLKLAGNQTHIAYDGLEAVEAAATFRPEVVLLDIGLPKLNGYEAARQIRAQPWGKKMVLVALTGWGQDEDRHKSREAGFDAHMVKPVDLAALTKLLAKLPAPA
ncbi:MAG TPA: chemotaxis protein CheB [Candidatus Limnocylindria bacterium]|nr:chemotaxis protein CheB [Candidatus Limnocylindria bacterium]